MRGGLRVFDADGHVVEPADLFRPWCPPGRPVLDLPSTTPMIPCGDAERIADQMEHRFDPPSYLRALDAQGIDVAVVYPSLGLFVPFQPELGAQESAAACRAYNEWVAAWCAEGGGRLHASGLVPVADPALAAREAEHAAALGLVAVLVRPNHLTDDHLGSPAFDPLYAAVADAGIVLAVHEGLGVRGPTIGSDRFTTFAQRHACSHPLEQMTAMAALLLGGALERHPTLRVAFLESGTGWLPYWLDRLDAHRDWLRDTECAALTRAPSEMFDDQCAISSEADDHLVAWVCQEVGADHVMWASDFPHPDAVFPGAADEFIGERGVPRADLEAVLWDTPLRFYALRDRVTV